MGRSAGVEGGVSGPHDDGLDARDEIELEDDFREMLKVGRESGVLKKSKVPDFRCCIFAPNFSRLRLGEENEVCENERTREWLDDGRALEPR